MTHPPHDDSYTPGYVHAARKIVAMINADGLVPGDRLPAESDLARTLGISHTVTREAIKVLSAIGKVSAQTGRGLYVADAPAMFHDEPEFAPLEVGDVIALFEFRRMLESELAGLAATRATPPEVATMGAALDAYAIALEQQDFDASSAADEAFHASVGEAAHNKFLNAAASAARTRASKSAVMVVQHVIAGRHHSAAAEHRSIYDAIRRGDEAAARTAAADHIDRALQDVRTEIARRMSETTPAVSDVAAGA
jgi:DNA-binding FadR family transcriptional regulator